MQLISGVNTSGFYAFSAASAGLATNDENGNNITQTYVPNASLEYNAVDEISGIAGSAISQYGAEKQWLVHDDTIVSISNSAQYAFGCNISALQRLMGIDETVLYSGSTAQATATTTADLNDAWTNYNKIKVSFRHSFRTSNTAYGGNHCQELTSPAISSGFTIGVPGIYDDGGAVFFDRNSFGFTSATPYKFTIIAQGSRIGFSTSAAWNVTQSRGVSDIVVIGIGRKS
jgi:hypothetical protein